MNTYPLITAVIIGGPHDGAEYTVNSDCRQITIGLANKASHYLFANTTTQQGKKWVFAYTTNPNPKK